MSDWVTVAKTADVPTGTVLGTRIGHLEVAVYNIDGVYYSTHNFCTHAYVLLSDGWLEDDIIECPLHGGRFEVKTGKGLGAPITCDLTTMQTRVEGDSIQVFVPASENA